MAIPPPMPHDPRFPWLSGKVARPGSPGRSVAGNARVARARAAMRGRWGAEGARLIRSEAQAYSAAKASPLPGVRRPGFDPFKALSGKDKAEVRGLLPKDEPTQLPDGRYVNQRVAPGPVNPWNNLVQVVAIKAEAARARRTAAHPSRMTSSPIAMLREQRAIEREAELVMRTEEGLRSKALKTPFSSSEARAPGRNPFAPAPVANDHMLKQLLALNMRQEVHSAFLARERAAAKQRAESRVSTNAEALAELRKAYAAVREKDRSSPMLAELQRRARNFGGEITENAVAPGGNPGEGSPLAWSEYKEELRAIPAVRILADLYFRAEGRPERVLDSKGKPVPGMQQLFSELKATGLAEYGRWSPLTKHYEALAGSRQLEKLDPSLAASLPSWNPRALREALAGFDRGAVRDMRLPPALMRRCLEWIDRARELQAEWRRAGGQGPVPAEQRPAVPPLSQGAWLEDMANRLQGRQQALEASIRERRALLATSRASIEALAAKSISAYQNGEESKARELRNDAKRIADNAWRMADDLVAELRDLEGLRSPTTSSDQELQWEAQRLRQAATVMGGPVRTPRVEGRLRTLGTRGGAMNEGDALTETDPGSFRLLSGKWRGVQMRNLPMGMLEWLAEGGWGRQKRRRKFPDATFAETPFDPQGIVFPDASQSARAEVIARNARAYIDSPVGRRAYAQYVERELENVAGMERRSDEASFGADMARRSLQRQRSIDPRQGTGGGRAIDPAILQEAERQYRERLASMKARAAGALAKMRENPTRKVRELDSAQMLKRMELSAENVRDRYIANMHHERILEETGDMALAERERGRLMAELRYRMDREWLEFRRKEPERIGAPQDWIRRPEAFLQDLEEGDWVQKAVHRLEQERQARDSEREQFRKNWVQSQADAAKDGNPHLARTYMARWYVDHRHWEAHKGDSLAQLPSRESAAISAAISQDFAEHMPGWRPSRAWRSLGMGGQGEQGEGFAEASAGAVRRLEDLHDRMDRATSRKQVASLMEEASRLFLERVRTGSEGHLDREDSLTGDELRQMFPGASGKVLLVSDPRFPQKDRFERTLRPDTWTGEGAFEGHARPDPGMPAQRGAPGGFFSFLPEDADPFSSPQEAHWADHPHPGVRSLINKGYLRYQGLAGEGAETENLRDYAADRVTREDILRRRELGEGSAELAPVTVPFPEDLQGPDEPFVGPPRPGRMTAKDLEYAESHSVHDIEALAQGRERARLEDEEHSLAWSSEQSGEEVVGWRNEELRDWVSWAAQGSNDAWQERNASRSRGYDPMPGAGGYVSDPSEGSAEDVEAYRQERFKRD